MREASLRKRKPNHSRFVQYHRTIDKKADIAHEVEVEVSGERDLGQSGGSRYPGCRPWPSSRSPEGLSADLLRTTTLSFSAPLTGRTVLRRRWSVSITKVKVVSQAKSRKTRIRARGEKR